MFERIVDDQVELWEADFVYGALKPVSHPIRSLVLGQVRDPVWYQISDEVRDSIREALGCTVSRF